MAAEEQATITIGPYEVIGRPSVEDAASFVARRRSPDGHERLVMLTVLPRSSTDADLEREIEISRRLNHPAIPRVEKLFAWEDSYVVATEHLDGVRLARLKAHLESKQQRLADVAIWYVGFQIAGALARAHLATDEHGHPAWVVHGRVAPERVLIGWDGRVQLVGAGLPTVVARETSLEPAHTTEGYQAPERAAQRRLTPGADVYSLGVLLWSLLTGQEPEGAPRRLPPLGNFRPDLDEDLANLIARATEIEVGARRIRCLDIERELRTRVQITAGKAALRADVERLRALLGLAGVAPSRPSSPPVSAADAPTPTSSAFNEDSYADPPELAGALVHSQSFDPPSKFGPSHPIAVRQDRARRTLSPSMWLSLGALLVVGGLLTWRLWPGSHPTVSAQPPPSPPAEPSSTPSESSATSATAPPAAPPLQPDTSEAPVSSAPEPDRSELLSYEGYLFVKSSAKAEVFVQGKHLGPTNRRLRSHCHQRYVRIGSLPGPRWLAPGMAVRIACGGTTTISIEPAPEAGP